MRIAQLQRQAEASQVRNDSLTPAQWRTGWATGKKYVFGIYSPKHAWQIGVPWFNVAIVNDARTDIIATNSRSFGTLSGRVAADGSFDLVSQPNAAGSKAHLKGRLLANQGLEVTTYEVSKPNGSGAPQTISIEGRLPSRLNLTLPLPKDWK